MTIKYIVFITRTNPHEKIISRLMKQADLCDGVEMPVISEKVSMTIDAVTPEKETKIRECIKQACVEAGCKLLTYRRA